MFISSFLSPYRVQQCHYIFHGFRQHSSTDPTIWFERTALGTAKSNSDAIFQFEERSEQVEEISSALEVRQDNNDGEVCC